MTTPKRPAVAPAIDLAGGNASDASEAPPTADELEDAESLRRALEDPKVSHEDADLLRAVALAQAPRPLGDDDHRALVERALARRASARPTARVLHLAFGGAAALALAAGVALLVRGADAPAPSAIAPALAQVRSTQALFQEPFVREGGESARIDRIALARASDFRDNEFTRWGIR